MKIHQRLQFALAVWLAGAAALRATEMVDVLILYTPEVAAVYTDHDGVEAHALATIANANAGFANSGLDLQLRLARLEATAYTESAVSFQEDLNRLSGEDDGFLDEVHALRDAWGADLVCLFRDGTLGGTAGLANLLGSETGQESVAFSVVEAVSAISNLTFVHEIGHNFGGGHARGDSGSGGLFEHSNGYRFSGGNGITYRTIMAYAPGSRINQFSTPDLIHQSVPTGKAASDPESADNAATFELTGPFIAQYRDHMPAIPGYLGVSPNLALASGGATVLHAEAVGAPELVRQWYEGVTGDESNPLAGETASRLETGALTETTYFWQKATNPNGSAHSPTIVVSVTPQPAEANAIDQAQSLVQFGFIMPWDQTADGLVFEPYWQEFVPSANYTDTIEVSLWKGSGGDPAGGIFFQLLDESGYVLYEETVLPGALTANMPKWISLPIKMYLNPGDTYRLQAYSIEPLDPSNGIVFIWSSHNGYANPYPAGDSSLDYHPGYNTEPGYEGIDFSFRTTGSAAVSPLTEINPISSSVGAVSGSFDIAVTSNTVWSVAESLEWLTASPVSGTGNATVTISYAANPGAEARSGTFSIGGNAHQITQAGAALFVALEPTSRSIDSSGGSYALSISSNGDWTLSEGAAWLSVTPASGVGDGAATVTVEANTSPLHRSAVVVAAEGTHTVVQYGVISSEMDFAEWLAAYFSGEETAAMTPSPQLVDTDGDGASNELEFRFGLNPAAESAAIELSLTVENANLVFEFSHADPDFEYTVFRSFDLMDWAETDLEVTLDNGAARFTAAADGAVFYRVVGEPKQ